MIEYIFLLNLYYFLHLRLDNQTISPKIELIKNINLFILIFFIGFRSNIGGDYQEYNDLSDQLNSISLFQSIKYYDKPLFTLLIKSTNLIFSESTIYTYNFVFGLIFSVLLHKFCNEQKNYFFCMFLSFPIITVLMGMGFVAQGLSLVIAWQILINFNNKSLKNIIVTIFIAFLFHTSAIIFCLLLIPKIIEKKKLNLNYIKIIIITFILFIITSFYYVVENYNAYLSYESISRGFQVRLLYFSIFYFLFLYFMKFFQNNNFEYISLFKFCFPLIVFTALINFIFLSNNFSVILDRLLLYFFFIPIIVSERLIYYLKNNSVKVFISLSLYFVNNFYFIIWSNASIYSKYWIPYKNTIINSF